MGLLCKIIDHEQRKVPLINLNSISCVHCAKYKRLVIFTTLLHIMIFDQLVFKVLEVSEAKKLYKRNVWRLWVI